MCRWVTFRTASHGSLDWNDNFRMGSHRGTTQSHVWTRASFVVGRRATELAAPALRFACRLRRPRVPLTLPLFALRPQLRIGTISPSLSDTSRVNRLCTSVVPLIADLVFDSTSLLFDGVALREEFPQPSQLL